MDYNEDPEKHAASSSIRRGREHYETVARMYAEEGFGWTEIATIYGVSNSTARQWGLRAKRMGIEATRPVCPHCGASQSRWKTDPTKETR